MLPYTVLLLTSFVGLAVARPKHAFLHKQKRNLTPDNTCGNIAAGNDKGYTCDPSDFWGGGCCSQYGYCGMGVWDLLSSQHGLTLYRKFT